MTRVLPYVSARLKTRRRTVGWVLGFAALLAVALLLRVVALFATPLIPEEAYYWMYARHPSLSYFDHPPMVAWVIRLGTALFGDHEFGVRVVGHVLMLAASGLMYAYGRLWFGRAAALLAAVAIQALPVYFGIGLIATMDSALLCYWLACLVGVSLALRRGRAWGWYLAGLALGAAMLTKYTAVFLAGGTALALVLHRPWRRHLRSIHPYLAFALAAAMFSPVLIWNARHDWASFRFQFVDRFEEKPASFGVRFIAIFALYQLMALTPLLLWAAGAFYARAFRRPRRLVRSPRWLFAACFSLPLLAVMAYKSATYEVHINWTLPAFLALLPALARAALARWRAVRTSREHRRRSSAGWAWTALACVTIDALALVYLLAVQPRVHWVTGFGPWPQLAGVVEEYEDRLEAQSGREPLVVAGGKYRMASVLAFYRRPYESDIDTADYTTSHWVLSGTGLSYRFWGDRDRWRGADCIIVDDRDNDVVAEARHYFQSVEQVNDPRLRRLGPKHYRITIGHGLRLPPA
jgi:dolichol-phosphate mannosyltransferase